MRIKRPIDDFSTDDLLDEIRRRAKVEEAAEGERPINPCDECSNFKPFGNASPMPDDYNPCGKGHKMQFRMPDYVGTDWGFHRRNCKDRAGLAAT